VAIGGNGLTIGAGGLDMSVATQPLTIALTAGQTITLGASQTWRLGATVTPFTGSGQTLTISSPIVGAAAATLTYGVTNAGATGTSGTVQLLAANTYAGGTVVGGPFTTYVLGTSTMTDGSGNVLSGPFGTGNVNLNSFNSAPQLQPSGNTTLANTMTWNSGFMLTNGSTGDLTLTGAITLTGTTAGNRTINNVSSTGRTVFVNGNVITAPSATDAVTRNLVLQTNPGPIVVNGQVMDFSPTATSSGLLVKTQAGTATVNSTANTFRGAVQIQGGTLEVMALADQGTASSLGTGATTPTIAMGSALNATLRYIGTGAAGTASTNRPINMAGATTTVTLDSSGGGPVTFSANLTATGAGIKTLTLTGSNTGANTIAGIIPDNSATNTTALSKTGPGTWVLSGANTYSGGTTITDGTLRVNNTSGNGPVTVTGTGTVGSGGTLGGIGTVGAPTISSTTPATQGGTVAPGNSIGALAAGGNTTFNPLGRYLFEYNPVTTTPVPGTDNDLIQGSILNLSNLTATPTGRFTVTFQPIGGSATTTNPVNYIAGQFATVTLPGGVTDINTLFTFTGSFAGTPTASFSGGNLTFSFVPVPEPGHVLLACAAVAALAGWRQSRRHD